MRFRIPRPRRYGRLSALGTALVLVAVGATAVAAPIEPGQSAPIVGAQSGRCLTVPGAGTTNGTQTQLWDCTGAAGQTWTYTAGKQLTVSGDKCLDASGRGTTNGTPVIIWDCNGQNNQQWN
ncbi:RICIN domain-containing protein, partial [Streptomyces vastus]